MTDEKWQQVVGQVKDSFGVLEEHKEDLPEEDGGGFVEIVEFEGPLGRIMLERTTKPVVLGKQTHGGSRRIGSEATVKYVYSDSEVSHKFRVYRWDENQDDWVEMEMEKGEMIF